MTWWRPVIVGAALLAPLPACNERVANPAPPRRTAATPAGQCEHGLPPALCTKCKPALAAVFQAKGDWCKKHGFPQSFCPVCKPKAAIPEVGPTPASEADWCVEHALPESKCSKCNPSLIKRFKEAGDWCERHGFPESVCPVCNPQRPPPGIEKAAIEARVLRFRSADIERSAGIRTTVARRAQASAAIECTTRIAFDSDRVADIRAIVPGIVRRIRAKLGARVKRGAPLFELESTRVGEIQGALQKAQGKIRTAQANLDRQRKLKASDISSARQVEVAERELATAQAEARAARATLRMAGAARSTPSGPLHALCPDSWARRPQTGSCGPAGDRERVARDDRGHLGDVGAV